MSKSFGKVCAVHALDLVLERGRVYGLLGPNGSCKTTTMRLILSILLPDEGAIRVLGRASASESKRRIGYLPEERGLYKRMRVRSFLRYMARLRGVDRRGLDRRVRDWLARVDLADRIDAKCGDLSRGQQQRVQAIAALIHEPDLLILDEPFSGLDPVNRRQLEAIFAEQHARGCTLVVSTHMMHHAEEVCDHVVMMHQGAKVLDAPLAEARTSVDANLLVCAPRDPAADLGPLQRLAGVAGVRRERGTVRVSLEEGRDPSAMIPAVARALPMARVEVERLSLEEIFVRTVLQHGGVA